MWQIPSIIIGFVFFGCLSEAQTTRRCSPSDISSITFTAKCFTQSDDKQNIVSCTEPAIPRTIAQITCKWGYETTNAQSQVLTCNSNGRWSPPPTDCSQKCGMEAVDGTPLIIGGGNANIQKVPWHVGIYQEVGDDDTLIQQCGGTIISAKVIVSAAHCFWNRNQNRLNDASDFRVVAGKYYRDLYDPRENNTIQIFGVEHIHLVAGYLDYEGLFANDVAVVILKNFIEFKVNAAPACIEEYKYDEKIVPAGAVGRVAGWGLVASGGDPSPKLKQIDVPVVQREACLRELTTDFHPFVTSDKFCAGFLTGSSVCQGDSGGGLVFPKMINGRKYYYLRGIVSTGQYKGGSCDNDKYALYTNTAHFWDLIQYHEIANRPTVKISAGTSSHNYECPRIDESRLVLSQCATNDVVKVCNETVEIGSTVTTACIRGYDSRAPILHKCEKNLEWWPPVIPCKAVCGRIPSPIYTPWLVHMRLYDESSGWVFISTGTLVSDRVVLVIITIPFLVFTQDISQIQVIAGAMALGLEQPHIQRRNLAERFLFPNPLNANDRSFLILIVDKPFDINSDYVAPVCLDLSTINVNINNEAPIGETGLVGAFVNDKAEVKQNDYTILDNSKCKSNTSNNDLELSLGKMCARRPVAAGGIQCVMVRSAGFAIPRVENGENIYYLKGIAQGAYGDNPAQSQECVLDEFQLFININYYKEEIQENILKYRSAADQSHVPSNKLCTVSYVPANGFVSAFENSAIKLEVGNEIDHMSVIEYSCEIGFFLIGSDVNTCMNGLWSKPVPRCEGGSSKVRCTSTRPPTNGFAIQTETKYGRMYVFGCDKGFSLPSKYPNQSHCRDGKWVPAIPENCIATKACTPIVEKIPFTLSDCSINGLEKLCNEAVDVGAKVTKACKMGYGNRMPIVHTCQSNGEWSPPVTNCTATCGRTPSLPHIPWLVKIYHRGADGAFAFTHSGVIVSDRVILTRAKANYNLLQDNIDELKVFAGSLTFQTHPNEQLQERKLVERLPIPNPIDMNDRTFVILIVAKPFDFSLNHVGPVCLDFYQAFSHANSGTLIGQTGSVAAFGNVGSRIEIIGDTVGFIQQNFYKILDSSVCKTNDTNFKRELTQGKMCARRPVRNTYDREGCPLVEGAGLVISKFEHGENVHYLQGIAINGFSEAENRRCVADEFQLFFNINYYKDAIQRYIMEYS